MTIQGKNFFEIAPPKSLDAGDLKLIAALDPLSLEDACATLAAFTADTIVSSIDHFTANAPKLWILAGGRWNNPIIYRELKARLKKRLGPAVELMTASEVSWDSQTIEAQIFAYLAVRSLHNAPLRAWHNRCARTANGRFCAYSPQRPDLACR